MDHHPFQNLSVNLLCACHFSRHKVYNKKQNGPVPALVMHWRGDRKLSKSVCKIETVLYDSKYNKNSKARKVIGNDLRAVFRNVLLKALIEDRTLERLEGDGNVHQRLHGEEPPNRSSTCKDITKHYESDQWGWSWRGGVDSGGEVTSYNPALELTYSILSNVSSASLLNMLANK